MRALLLFGIASFGLVGVSCSDPYGGYRFDNPCFEGFVLDPGPHCTVPRMRSQIDGDSSEWAPGGAFHSSGALQFARDEQRALLVFLRADPEYFKKGYVRWAIGMRRPGMLAADPYNSNVVFVIGDGWVSVSYNRLDFVRVSVPYAYAVDGIELEIPLELIPFAGAAYFDDVYLLYDGEQFVQGYESYFSSSLCWDPTQPDGLCDQPL